MIHNLLALKRPIFAIDGEMTGVHRDRDRLIQLGVVKLDVDGSMTEWVQLFNPGMHIPVEATAVHHITDEMVEDAPTFDSMAIALHKRFHGADFVGYNTPFDLGFLAAEFKRSRLEFKPGAIIDGFKIFARMSPRNLEAAARRYAVDYVPTLPSGTHDVGLDREMFHDALYDAKMALAVIKGQLEEHAELPRTVEALHKLFFETVADGKIDPDGKFAWRDGQPVINFGKHAGCLLRNAPRSYLEWIATADFPPKTKEIAQDALMGKYPMKE